MPDPGARRPPDRSAGFALADHWQRHLADLDARRIEALAPPALRDELARLAAEVSALYR